MSRGFIGSGGAGGNKRDLLKKKSLMATLAMSRNRKQTRGEMIRERTSHQMKDYKEMIEDMLDEKMFSSGARPEHFHLPGTTPPEEKEMSKGRKAALEHFKMKQMKKRMKQREQKVDIVPRNYNGRAGGWLDKKGKIRNKNGDIVMQIDPKTGVITDRMGMKVGKYKANSYSNDYKIQRLIDRYTKNQKVFNPFGGDPKNNQFNPFGAKD